MKRVVALGATLALLVAPVLVRLLKAQSPPTHFAVLPPASANVGFVFNFPVTAFDSSNNSAKSYTGTVHFTSTDPQAVLPPDYTFTTGDSGTHMFSATLNTPGTQTITATDTANGAITGTSSSITVSATPPPPPPTFSLTDLGPLQITAAPAGATAFNASGQVTGFRFENFPSPVCFAGGADRAFLWSNGVYTELGTLGGYSSFGYGINNAGQIVGSSDACPNGLEVGQRAFIWQNGSMTALDPSTNSNDSSVALAINTNGDVAGYTNHVGNSANPQAVIWKGGTAAGLTVLQSLACQFTACQTRALAINDSGQAAGWGLGPFVSGRAGSYNANQAVMWNANGQSTGLGSLGNFWSDQANAINSKGDVVGYSQLDPGVYYSIVRAVVWQNGNPQNPRDLGTIPGFDPLFGVGVNITDNSSSAWGINSKGEIVGISADGSGVVIQGNGGRAFLYIPTPAPGTGGQTYDLLSLLAPGTNWRQLQAAWAINDNGQILGVGIDPNQQEHGFLLTPIIALTTTALTTSGTPSVFGQSVSFTATVTPVPPNPNAANDTVTFYDGNMTLASGTYNGNGVWILNTTLSVASHSITASYSGDNNFGASTSTTLSQTVGQAGTVTGLTASANTPNVGQSVTFTANVSVTAPGAGTPTGTVSFFANGTSLTCAAGSQTAVSAGQATCQYAFGTAGAESITASYSGDTDFTGSTTASPVTVTVQSPFVQVTDNETIHIADTVSFADVYDTEAVHVADAAFVTPLIQVSAPVAEFSAGTLGFSGQGGSQTITVSDIGTASLTLASATISGSSQFAITQIACSNGSTSASTTLPSGGACVLTIGYTASVTPANDNATLVFTDNAALSNVASVPSGSSYAQSIPLSGSGTTTPPPPPPPAVVPVMDNETIHVADAESFEDVYDTEAVHVADAVFVTPLIQVSAPVAEFSAGSLGFSGQSGSQTITVSDIGTASLTLASATISGSSQFSITQIACSNSATSASTTLPSGGACVLTIGYTASATPANDNGTLVFTDNAALSNVASVKSGSSYMQSIALSGSGTSTPPPPPPPAVIPVTDNETIHVADAESFEDVYDTEAVHVADAVFVTPLTQVSAPVAEFSAGALGFSGQSGSQTITVSDIGTASLTLASAAISGSSQFSITQIACSNSAISFSTMIPSGGACVLTIGYTASATPANDNGTLVFTDNAALSNVVSTPAGSSYTQSIPLSGSGTTTGPPPPPPAVVPVMDNETIHVADAESFEDVYDTEAVHVADAVFVTPLIQVSAPVAEFSAGTLGFSGQSGGQTITVSDIGTAALTVASATISGSSQFAITQIACSTSATSFSTILQSGGACVLTIGYSASATPANDNGTLVFTDNAALSNVASAKSGSSYMQSIPLSGSGTTTAPPPPPPAVIPVMDNETITVSDTETFHDVFDGEAITVTDQVTIQIISIPTTTSITAPQAPYGTASATVSVSASSGTATGIVTLSVDGGSPLSMKLAGGSATFSLATLNAGTHSLSANFAAQGAFAASSALAKISIVQASPTVSFAGAPSSAAYQSAFTVATATNATTTATITASGACSIAGTTVTMTSGTGTCTLTANWPADTNYLAATATQTTAATKIAATVSFTGAPATAPYNSTFVVTAATNASTTATITASGVCSITGTKVTMTSGTGSCGLLAQWPADSNYLAAAAKQSTTATLALSKTVITVSSPNPSVVGQAVTVKFIVTGNGLPTGTVTISDGTGDSCTATVASGGCSISITSAGAKTLTAVYGGDNNFAGSTSAGVSQTVNKGNTIIKITAHSPSSSVAGQPVTISFVVAVVAPASGVVSGSVTLSDGVGDTCRAPVSSGTCSMIFAAAGTKTVTASYAGDNNFNPSTSSSVTQTVTDFTMSAKPSSQIIKAGQKAGYNTTLAPLNAFVGTVAVSCGGTPQGATCTVSPNSATLNGSMAMTLSISVPTSRSTPTGNYTLTLKGIFGSGVPASGGLTHTATVTLTVQ